MAKVYRAPKGIIKPEFNVNDIQGSLEAEIKYEKEIIDFCKNVSSHKYAGTVLRFPIADGYATYVVYNGREMIHVDTGDAYQIPEAHSRGIRINEEAKRAIAINKLWGNN